MEKPGERGALGLIHPPPGDHAAVLRAGERHVEEAKVLGELFAPGRRARRLVRLEVEHLPVAFRPALVVGGVPVPAPGRIPGVPGERQEDDGKLEALRPVHGEDPDERFVALDPELRILVAGPRLRAPPAEPPREGGGRRPQVRLRLLEELRQVPDVREPPRPVPVAEQAGRAPLRFHEAAKERADPLRRPFGAPGAQPVRPPGPRFLVFLELVQAARVEPEEIARERAPFPPLPARLDQRPQQALHLLRLARVEHARVADLDARHPALAESVRDRAALGPGADEHRDVRAGELPRLVAGGRPVDDRLPVLGQHEEAGDLLRRIVHREGRSLALGPCLAVRPRGEEAEPERPVSGRCLVLDPQGIPAVPPRGDRRV